MTEDELSELVKEHRAFAEAHVPGKHDAMVEFHRNTADAIESLRASLANAERRAELAEERYDMLCEAVDAIKELRDGVAKP